MTNVPRPHPTRPGWVCQSLPEGGIVGWPIESRAEIIANHVDGPLLIFRNGELHWLTFWERFLFWIGEETAVTLERKHRPELTALDKP